MQQNSGESRSHETEVNDIVLFWEDSTEER